MATQGKIRIYKREAKKGFTYTYSIEAGREPTTGKRKRVTKSGFKSQREARQAAQSVLNKLLLGQNVIESNVTFSEYADEWLNEHKINLKPYTVRNLNIAVKRLKKIFNDVKIKDVTPFMYQQFLNKCATDMNFGFATIKKLDTYARMIFKQAMKYNIIMTDPTANRNLPKKETNNKDVTNLYLTKDELKKFLNFAKNELKGNNEYFYFICLTLAYTGLRFGEAAAIRWQDVNFEKKYIDINSTLFMQNSANFIRQETPKTASSSRKIIIDDFLIQELKKWKIRQIELRLLNKTISKLNDYDFVFTKHTKNNYECPISNNTFNVLLYKINKEININKQLHAHILRHTHASLLAEAGISLEIIQERLGHSDSKITKSIYLHITEKSKKDAADIFANYMLK